MESTRTISVSGLDDLEQGFAKLALYAQKTVIKDALKEAAQTVVDAARELVPVKTGQLQRAIRVRVGRSGKSNLSMLAAAGKRWFTGDQFYGAFQEFGWQSGKRNSKNRKQQPGEHYMEYAFDEKAQYALDAMLRKMRDGLERELK